MEGGKHAKARGSAGAAKLSGPPLAASTAKHPSNSSRSPRSPAAPPTALDDAATATADPADRSQKPSFASGSAKPPSGRGKSRPAAADNSTSNGTSDDASTAGTRSASRSRKESSDPDAAALDWAIGRAVRIVLVAPVAAVAAAVLAESNVTTAINGNAHAASAASAAPSNLVEGLVYAYDPKHSLVVVQCASRTTGTSTATVDLRFINTAAIAQVTLLPLPVAGEETGGAAAGRLLEVRAVHWEAAVHLEEHNVRAMEAKLARFGVGVDPSAQLLFDALAKTMSCRWHDATIVVMEQVLVDAPYTPSACRSKDARALERVRKVLQGERRKLRLGDE